jgi:hypothetical protein
MNNSPATLSPFQRAWITLFATAFTMIALIVLGLLG